MAAALPFLPLYASDYLADTQHLTTEQHGAYFLLLLNYWQTGKPLDNTNDRLATVARLSKTRWRIVEPVLIPFFQVVENEWHHGRVEFELEKVLEKSRKSSYAGQESARKRRNEKLSILERENRTKASTPVERPLNARSVSAQHKLNQAEAEAEAEADKRKDLHQSRIDVARDFEIFWKTYPRKVAKAPALKAYLKARQKYSFDEIQLGVVGYLRVCGDDPKFVAHPATWLNQVRFLDPNPQVEVKGAPSQSSNHLGVLGERAHTAINALGQYGVQICAQCEISWPCPKSLENLGGVAR